MKNIMTIDLEDYYHCNLSDKFEDNVTSTVEKNVEELLRLFEKNNVKATFFTLGSVAEKHKDLIKKIDDNNHEIASHGYGHELCYKLSKKALISDINKSKKILENITNKKVYGYRAPSWSITKDNLWIYDELEKMGFKYSSSVFPIKTFLYGIPDAPKYPNHPVVNGKEKSIYEMPPGTQNFIIKTLGFSGGFYFRFFPLFIIKMIIKHKNKKGIPVVCYLHPWEIDQDPPKLNLKGINKLIHYYGIKRCKKKFDKLLDSFEFTTMIDYINSELLDNV